MSYSVVVARYNEDVEWSKQFSNVIVYNKGDILKDGYNEVVLNNVGREGHTYYQYICDNYYNLSDYTIFLQGNPFDHSPNLIDNINKYMNRVFEFEFLSEVILDCQLSGCKYHQGLPIINTYEKIFHKPENDICFQFGSGAQFIVSKKKILNKPVKFYQTIVEILENEISPIEGYVIERLHKLIFE